MKFILKKLAEEWGKESTRALCKIVQPDVFIKLSETREKNFASVFILFCYGLLPHFALGDVIFQASSHPQFMFQNETRLRTRALMKCCFSSWQSFSSDLKNKTFYNSRLYELIVGLSMLWHVLPKPLLQRDTA